MLRKSCIVLFVIIISACTTGQKAVVSPVEMEVNSKVFGVGYSEDMALTDSYSVYYAIKQGVNYEYNKGELKLKLDFKNIDQSVTVEDLTNSQVNRVSNGFYVYEYVYSGKVLLKNKNKKTVSLTLRLEKPFSYLSKLLAKSLLEEYKNIKKKIKGTIYITNLSYDLADNGSILIHADLLINESVEDRK